MFSDIDWQDLTFGGPIETGTTSTSDSRSADEIYSEIVNSMEYLDSLRPVIYIWKGGLSNFYPKGLEPKLHYSELVLNPDAAYIVAGFGIVAGWKAYEFLRKLQVKLRWSDTYIPLEEQEDYPKIKDVLDGD